MNEEPRITWDEFKKTELAELEEAKKFGLSVNPLLELPDMIPNQEALYRVMNAAMDNLAHSNFPPFLMQAIPNPREIAAMEKVANSMIEIRPNVVDGFLVRKGEVYCGRKYLGCFEIGKDGITIP